MSESELKAHRHIISNSKLNWYERKSFYKSSKSNFQALVNVEPEVLKLIENGVIVFYERVATRILKEHREKIFINNCKNCGKLTRSPQAKQCRHCGYKWFDNDDKQHYTCV